MKIKSLKPYWIIGTLVTAGIITVGTYNFIIANNKNEIATMNNQVVQLQEIDYNNKISELEERLLNAESKITSLEEKITNLETSNEEKDNTIKELMNQKKSQV